MPEGSRTTCRVADAIARRLFQAGIRHAFGMPGGEVLTIVDALEAAGIAFHLARHENAAGFMAEGVWHRTGAPGLLVATVGPGALNAVNVMENARQDRVPLILIAGAVDADEAESYTHQVLDQRRLFEAVSKASFTVTAGAAAIVADKAVAIATEARPGPVHLDLPISVADAPIAALPGPRRADASPVVPAPGADLEQARAALRAAERPVVIAGLDAVNEGAGAALTAFAETVGAPVITTYKAKGLLPEDHPLALGGAGLSPKADRVLLPFVAEADLVICAGYDPIEMRVGWREAVDPARHTVIDITAAPNHHYMHQASLAFVAQTAPTLETLLQGGGPSARWPADALERVRAELAQAFPADEPWGPAAIIDTCRTVLPADTLATADSGAHRILLSQMWRCAEPRGLVQSSGLCTMGCAVPLALGMKIASPDRPVVSFSGDAGFLMVAGELATAAEMGLPVIFVVFADASLALIELKQRQRQLANRGVDFAPTDLAAVARAFGGVGETVADRQSLGAALERALQAQTFTVIAAQIDRGAYDGRL